MIQNSRIQRPASTLSRAVSATVEPLELRCMLSAVVYTDIDGDNIADVKVTGTSGTDRITVYLDPQNNFSAVHDDKNGNGKIDASELKYGPLPETVDISTLGGTDTVNVRLLSDLNFLPGRRAVSAPGDFNYAEGVNVYVDLGSGNDKFEFSSPTTPLSTNIATALSDAAETPVDSDPDGADMAEGGDLVLQVDGGTEKDTINFDFSRTSVICSSLIVTADSGAGDDLVNLTLPDFQGAGEGSESEPFEGIIGCYYGEDILPSNVSVAIDLSAGKNTLNINTRTVVANSDVHIDVDGGKDTDIINDNEEVFATSEVVSLVYASGLTADPVMEGRLPFPFFGAPDGRYVLDVELGSGNDAYYQNLSFEIEREVNRDVYIDRGGQVTYNVRGDSGKDVIRVTDVDNNSSTRANTAYIGGLLTYNLYGGTEDDIVEFDTDPGAQFLIAGGVLKVLVSGDGGNDFVRLDVALIPGGGDPSNGSAQLTLSGGSGNDKLAMTVAIPSAPALNGAVKGVSVFIPTGLFGPRGLPLLDGGAGSDKYDTEGNVNILKRGAETLDETLEPTYVP